MMVNKARMTQAKTVLSHLAKTETIYFTEHDRYTDNVILLDFDPVKYPYYQVSVVLDNGAKNYTGIASGVGAMAGDRWYVTKDGTRTRTTPPRSGEGGSSRLTLEIHDPDGGNDQIIPDQDHHFSPSSLWRFGKELIHESVSRRGSTP